jgi:hypothetical protein
VFCALRDDDVGVLCGDLCALRDMEMRGDLGVLRDDDVGVLRGDLGVLRDMEMRGME